MKQRFWLIAFILISVAPTLSADPSMEARCITGASAFLDEDIPFDHFVIGGAFGIYLTERLRIEPQILYMAGPGSDEDLEVTGSLAYDVLHHEKTRIYIVGGAGLLRSSGQLPNFTSYDPTTIGGIGLKQYLNANFFIGSEFRMGFGEPLFLISANVGFRF